MRGSRASSISGADTLEQIGEFWDSHDFTEFDTDTPDVEVRVRCAVPIEVDLFSSLEEQAHRRGVSVETLVNLWLLERLAQQTQGNLTPAGAGG